MANLAEMKRLSRALSRDEQKELVTYLQQLGGLGQDRDSEGPSWVQQTFATTCRTLGLGEYLPKPVRGEIDKRAASVVKFIEDTLPGTKEVEKRGILALGINLLYQDLRGAAPAGMSIRMLALNLDKIPAIFDKAFPGYVGVALGHVVGRKISAGVVSEK